MKLKQAAINRKIVLDYVKDAQSQSDQLVIYYYYLKCQSFSTAWRHRRILNFLRVLPYFFVLLIFNLIKWDVLWIIIREKTVFEHISIVSF